MKVASLLLSDISMLVVFFLLVTAACSPKSIPKAEQNPELLNIYSIPALPDWTWEFRDPGDIRYFIISKLMKDYKLSRLKAVEVQNRYRDILRPDSDITAQDRSTAFSQALADVLTSGKVENGLNLQTLSEKKFLVVFDLDNTLYDQHAPEEYSDFSFVRSGGSDKKIHIKLVPGWKELINRVNSLGGGVVFFTAWIDNEALENAKHWELDGTSILESGKVMGMLSHSHLVRRENQENEGRPLIIRQKDLRIVDPSLENVILIDNNPIHYFQYHRARIVPRYSAKQVSKLDSKSQAAYASVLMKIKEEIEDSVLYMDQANIGFGQAYLPYTALGRLVSDSLRSAHGWTEKQAVKHIRENPESVSNKY